MKVTRKMLLIIISALGILLVGYGLLRHFSNFEFGEKVDKWVSDIIVFSALGLFMYNRKLARDEKLAREAEEKAKAREEEEPEEELPEEDENLPHWERSKKANGEVSIEEQNEDEDSADDRD